MPQKVAPPIAVPPQRSKRGKLPAEPSSVGPIWLSGRTFRKLTPEPMLTTMYGCDTPHSEPCGCRFAHSVRANL